VRAVAERYKDKIDVLLGLELDYFSKTPEYKYDYLIGSVHYVKTPNTYIAVDLSPDDLKVKVGEEYGGDFLAFAKDYASCALNYDSDSIDATFHVESEDDLIASLLVMDDDNNIKSVITKLFNGKDEKDFSLGADLDLKEGFSVKAMLWNKLMKPLMYDKTIVITKIWNDGLTTEERLAAGIIPKLHLTNRVLSQDENFHTHTWDNGIILSNSTCSTNGEKLYTCTECDATNVEKQALLEHTWQLIEEVPSTCKEPGYTKYKCTDCNMPRQDALEILEHSWDEGVVTIEAACETSGEMLYTCTGCAITKTESTEPLGHDFTAADGTCIVCGASNYKYVSVVMKDAGSATISVSTSDYDYYNGSLRPYYSKIITFVPAVSGSYTFKANASADTYGRLYDKDMKSLTQDDDSGGSSQFKFTYNCIAGQVYYIAVGRYSNSSSATSIPVTITKTG
jgi:hypothetical protein